MFFSVSTLPFTAHIMYSIIIINNNNNNNIGGEKINPFKIFLLRLFYSNWYSLFSGQ